VIQQLTEVSMVTKQGISIILVVPTVGWMLCLLMANIVLACLHRNLFGVELSYHLITTGGKERMEHLQHVIVEQRYAEDQ
jgi:hypothetical protein